MDFHLNETQTMMRDMCRKFADNELKPIAAELDETGRFPAEKVAMMAEMGLMGIYVPEQYGGAGMDYLCYALAVEEISRGCASTGVILSAHTSLAVDPILKSGTEEQKRLFLPKMASGEWIGCFGLTEANAGTDAGGTKATAFDDGSEWVLNGTKNFITNAPQASVAVLFARTGKDPGAKHANISAFIIPMETKGISVGKVEHKLGIKASGTSELVMEDCRIPKSYLLGQEGQGFKVAMQTLDGGRIGIASQAVGIAQAAFEAAVEYSKQRVQFGKPICEFQAIQWMLADCATELDAARLLVWRAAMAKAEGQKRFSKESAMAKLFASEMSNRVCNKALQIHGGYGYVKEYPVERHLRDARITEIYEGTSEVQRMVIAASVLKD